MLEVTHPAVGGGQLKLSNNEIWPQSPELRKLLALEAKGLVTLFPAKYRIRKSTKATL